MKYRIFQIALMSLGLWLASCCTCPQTGDGPEVAEQGLTAPSDEDGDRKENANAQAVSDSDIIPVGDSPVLGDPSAPITVVEFSDFQCPFCQRGGQTLEQLQEKYPNDVRVVFKHYPLPFHKQAKDAARAAIAAGNQGKFWEMHDFLFENQKQFKQHPDDMKQWTSAYAEKLGLDVDKFQEDFDARETGQIIDRDVELGDEVNVQGTPHFFVNGERVKGAKPLAEFEQIVKAQLEEIEEMSDDGVAREDIYKEMVTENFDGGKPAPPKPSKPAQKVEFVPVEADDPVRGNADDALVTIVEFSDFQCPFCNKVTPTLDKIEEEYGDKVRIVFKQLPLQFHRQAKPAAQAALAAHQQGKFWEMHDLIFDKQRQLKANSSDLKGWFSGLANELGLNVDKFEKDYDDPKIAEQIDEDVKLSQKVGARGTPNFWINGINVRGAQPFAKFKSVIDEQLERAEKVQADEELSGDELYKKVVALNKKDAPQPAAKKPSPRQPDPKIDASKLTLEDAPSMGPNGAPVTIVEFSDFQCPYCKKGGANMKEAAAKFHGKVKIVFKHYPLPFHKQAKDAAKAAMAAGEQGKFWEMYELLFENQKQLKDAGIFAKLAKELGLDVDRFKEDMDNPEYDKVIDRDMKEGQQVGVRGTPAYFINGTRIVGAQPTTKFEDAIEDALNGDDS